jgi:AraC-like DNA-binding protein
MCVFLSSVARAEGFHDLGFHIAGHLGIESLGSYGRLVAKAFTFHEAIQITRELISTYNSGLRIWLEDHGDQVRYCQKYVGNLPRDGITEIVHLGLANTFAVAGAYRGTDWKPSRMELATDPIDLGVYVPGFVDLPVSFNQPQTSLWFDRTWLSKPLPSIESPHGSRTKDDERASLVATGPSAEPIGRLEQVIESSLGHPEMSLQHTAAIIGTSPRTLQRRLAEHDTSFSRSLQAVRFRTAQRLLRDPRMPLTEIAGRLGYTDPANFMRAFKRWTGIGPNDFRRLHYADSQV